MSRRNRKYDLSLFKFYEGRILYGIIVMDMGFDFSKRTIKTANRIIAQCGAIFTSSFLYIFPFQLNISLIRNV